MDPTAEKNHAVRFYVAQLRAIQAMASAVGSPDSRSNRRFRSSRSAKHDPNASLSRKACPGGPIRASTSTMPTASAAHAVHFAQCTLQGYRQSSYRHICNWAKPRQPRCCRGLGNHYPRWLVDVGAIAVGERVNCDCVRACQLSTNGDKRSECCVEARREADAESPALSWIGIEGQPTKPRGRSIEEESVDGYKVARTGR
jgi:hypothetical protein